MAHGTIARVCTLPDQEEIQLELTTLHLYTYHVTAFIKRCSRIGWLLLTKMKCIYVYIMIVIQAWKEEIKCAIKYSHVRNPLPSHSTREAYFRGDAIKCMRCVGSLS